MPTDSSMAPTSWPGSDRLARRQVLQEAGQTETATIFVLRAVEERQDAAGYAVALALAGISVLLLLFIEILKRRRFKEAES